MARRFVRVDLSDEARDFRPFALEPGVPMLDRSNANAKILFRWLGRLAAEPEWEGDSVSFYVQDDHGGRLEEVVCQPASEADLEHLLQEDLLTLKDRIEKAKPETATERAVKKMARRTFEELTEDPQRTDLDCHFFRYRDAGGRWRLVWCWGYQRADQEAAPAAVCTDPECSLLFVRRPGRSHRCPCCELAVATRPRKKVSRRRLAFAGLLLLLLAAVLCWLFWPKRPFVVPEKLHMVVGQIAELTVVDKGYGPVRITSPDPTVVEITKENRLIARSEGALEVEVVDGPRRCTVPVTVIGAEFGSIAVEPAWVVVPVDDTVRMRVLGQTGVGESARDVEIAPDLLTCQQRPSPRYAEFDPATMELRGLLPTEPGSPQTLAFVFQGHRGSAAVEVVMPPFDLALTPAGPIDLPVGQQMRLEGWVTYKGGRRVRVPSDRLTFSSESPAGAVAGLELRGERVAALKPGAGPIEVYADYFGRRSEPVVFRSVEAEPLTLRLEVDRKDRLAGEPGRVILTAAGPKDEDVELVPDLAEYRSSDPAVLKIDERTGAFRALAPGEVTITASHPAASGPAALKLGVSSPPAEDLPVAVRILTDQDQPVRFPVGAEFDDFRVEAEYADGLTRLVTKKATLRTPEGPQDAVVTPSGGRLVGVRPGRTAVTAEFEGVQSKEAPLQVEVVGGLDVDQISVVPADMTLLPGETVAMDVVGYKDGRPLGVITGLGGINFESTDARVARVEGRSVTGINVGRGSVVARLGDVVSRPAAVNVVSSITAGADAKRWSLVTDPKLIRIRVGEAVRIGPDVAVFRGEGDQRMDLSRQCTVTPALPGVVRYVPEIHSLVGVAPGASAVAFTFGDQLTNAMVEVVPAGGPIDGEVIVEPVRGTLVPGQAVELRVFVVTKGGERIDRTAAAVLSSSDPDTMVIRGNRACALRPGTSEITAVLPGAQSSGRAYLGVSEGEIDGLLVEPPEAVLSTGDLLRLRILGRGPTGTYEIFPQPGLTVTAGGPDPEAIQVIGSRDIRAARAGQASVTVNWGNRLGQQVPVTVTDDPLTDLRIEPARAVIHPGQPLVYQVTGMRSGRRRVLGPEHGVQLFVGDGDVARVIDDLAVCANRPGRTSVVARLGGQQAEASLEVTPGAGPGGGDVLVEVPGGVTRYGPGGGYWSGGGGGYWDDGYRYWDGERWVYGVPADGTYVEQVYVPPPAEVVGLCFSPDVLRLSPGSPPTGVRVFELLSGGHLGRDVTGEANLELSPERPGVVAVEKTASGPVLRPVGQGQARIDARLGNLAADPLLVHVGEVVPGLARLVVAPDPLSLWSGQTGTFERVLLDPGAGGRPFPVDYKITPAPNQGIVGSAGDQAVRGLSDGATQVVVTTVDPAGVYEGLSTTATVQVMGGDPLRIEPSRISLRVGQATPPLAVVAQGQDGLGYQVPATLESMDGVVLVADDQRPGRFMARALGGTEIRATYRGKQAFASVTVSGQRFVQVIDEDLDRGASDFGVILKVLADKSENPLQYRVYVTQQPPAEAAWAPAERLADGSQQVTLHSPRMQYGLPNTLYNLTIEARDPSDGSVQQYPFTFRLRPEIERADDRRLD